MRRSTIVFSLGLTAAVFASTPRAEACERECERPLRLFRNASDVPGNLVYFKVLDESLAPFTLKTKNGESIPASIRTIGDDRVFAPDKPIAGGTSVVLEYDWKCSKDSQVAHATFEFTTYDSLPVELRAPEVSFVRQGLAYPDSEQQSAFVEFEYYSADGDGSLGHLVDVQATVDGMSARLETPDHWRPILSLDSRCAPVAKEYAIDSCGEVGSVPPGTHTVEFTSTIVGHDTPASVQRTFDISCPEACKISPTDEDPPSRTDNNGKSKTGASGCSLGSSAATPGSGWFLAAAALWAGRSLTRHRKRKSGCC